MRVLIAFTFSLLSLFACKSSGDQSKAPANDSKGMEDQLMTMHDEVMPRLNDIQHLSSELRKIKTETKENQEGKLVYPDGLEENLDNLKLSEQGMWDWMKQYHDQRDSIPEDQLKQYLTKQLELMTSVKNGIEKSIDNASKWLEKN